MGKRTNKHHPATPKSPFQKETQLLWAEHNCFKDRRGGEGAQRANNERDKIGRNTKRTRTNAKLLGNLTRRNKRMDKDPKKP